MILFFLLKELLNTHTHIKRKYYFYHLFCAMYTIEEKKTERNHFSTAVFFITKLLHIEITPNYLK